LIADNPRLKHGLQIVYLETLAFQAAFPRYRFNAGTSANFIKPQLVLRS
jgi:hypothetical protein